MTDLRITVDPTEFFREQVNHALKNVSVQLNAEIEFYIVKLLCDFIRDNKLVTTTQEIDLLNTPLALILKHALEVTPDEQVKVFKALGDTSLYISGYFQDYFNDKTFDIDYFIGIGVNAYSNVSSLSRERDRSTAQKFSNLADNFKDIVEIVSHVADNLGPSQSKNILAIYDRWTKNQTSSRLRKKLEDSGICPIPMNIKKTH